MTLRRNDRIIRVGDRIRVTRANAGIKRIGYPLIFTELRDEARQSPEADAVVKILFGNRFASGLSRRSDPDRIPIYIVDAVAKSFVARRGFGGNERKIIYHPEPRRNSIGLMVDDFHPHLNHHYTVTRKRIAKTGTRFPSSGDGDDYEDGGLYDPKTHVILQLDNYMEIEVTDVELIRRGHATI